MICIRDKFSQNIGRQVSSSVIWDHLGTMYDMQALVRTHTNTRTPTHTHTLSRRTEPVLLHPQHESEILPFPNTEKSFSLPEEIIQEVKGGEVFLLIRLPPAVLTRF